ncbi:hypothetical protein LTR17_026879 [Elasticomyces elasticus]|nr:hypothetical protein LTR17_026879 [Elasticomyces elasticus]
MECAQTPRRDAKVAPAEYGSLQRRGTRDLIGGALRRSTCEICKDHRCCLDVHRIRNDLVEARLPCCSTLNSALDSGLKVIATLASPYQQFDVAYGVQDQDRHGPDQALVTNTTYQQLLTQGFQLQVQSPPTQSHGVSSFQQYDYGMSPILPSQVTAAELSYEMEQPQMVATQVQPGVPTRSSSQYGTPQESLEMLRYQPAASAGRKRSHHSDHSCGYQALKQLHAQAGSNTQMTPELTPHNRHLQLHASSYLVRSQPALPQPRCPQRSLQTVPSQTHHHHRLPNQGPLAKPRRTGESSPETDQYGPPNMVGQAGMPAPAPEPKDSKHKFTIKDDALLVELKKTKNLTWKQISNFFPGRSSGTLQVRYCTKLKAKTTVWTDATIKRLRTAVDEYEADRWRILSDKVGNGFSAAACREKAKSLVQPDVTVPSTKQTGPQTLANK